MWWKFIYDKWLREGDYRVLEYLQRIERYLSKGRAKSQQEFLNLTSQIEALIELPYDGEYTYILTNSNCLKEIKELLAYDPMIRLPDANNLKSLEEFFKDTEPRIRPQNTDFPCHQCWILWSSLFNNTNAKELWAYRKQFIYYMECADYLAAAQVYQYAMRMPVRTKPLPLYSPEILRHVMYCNIDAAIRRGVDPP